MSSTTKLSPLTQELIHYVDGTPNADYPLRLLRAYRQRADCRWSDTSEGGAESTLLVAMNEHCRQRAAILDAALRILGEHRTELVEAAAVAQGDDKASSK